jgi:A/G-specific adenine glycosylase
MLETQNIKVKSFASCLENWYTNNKRELPWRENIDPYSVWLSEIILQQTQVKQGWNYYLSIINAFPTIQELAKVSVDDFYPYWAGLGYYSRAKNLLKTAKIISDEYHNEFPTTKNELLKLPGIGDYTASAIASICFNRGDIAMDGNLNRVFCRVHQYGKDLKVQNHKNELKELASSLAPSTNLGDFNQSLMDLGSAICTKTNPKCNVCPVSPFCEAQKAGNQNSYPFKSKPVKKETLILHYFYNDKQNIHIKKRTEGIWNNLYELPGFWLNEKEDVVYQNFNFDINNIDLSKPTWVTKHLLSHKIMFIHFHSLSNLSLENFQTISYSQLNKIGFPKPIEVLLKGKNHI